MIKIDVKKTNAAMKEGHEKLKEAYSRQLEFNEHAPDFKDALYKLLKEFNYFSDWDKINFFDQEAFKLMSKAHKNCYYKHGLEYFYNRIHREFPDFGATMNDFIIMTYCMKELPPLMETIAKIVQDVKEHLLEMDKQEKKKKRKENE